MQPKSAITFRPATLKEVYDFFDRTTETLYRGLMPALFDPERLRKCDTAFVAESGGQIVGAVTVALSGANGPTLDSVYVHPTCRRRGVAYRLCEIAVRWFQAEGKTKVYCEVNSRLLHLALQRLPHELTALLTLNLAYQTYGDLPMPDDIDAP